MQAGPYDSPLCMYSFVHFGTETNCPWGAQDVPGPAQAWCPTFVHLSSITITFQLGRQCQPDPLPAWIPEPHTRWELFN